MKALRWRIAAAVVAVVVVAAVVWKEVLEDRLIPKRWGVVEAGSIYRSGQLHPALVRSTLQENGIDVIVNLNSWRPDKPAHVAEQRAAEELGIETRRFSLKGDGTGDVENYVQAVAEIDRSVREGKRVLVHCTAGTQRTGGAVALYRVLLQGRSPADALSEMATYGFDPEDDLALLRYLDDNTAYVGRRLVEIGVLDEVPDLGDGFM